MIKRYFASQDNYITNAFEANLLDRSSGSNFGNADVLEVFSIYGQNSSSSGLSSELSRALVQFPISTLIADRSSSVLPSSGNVSFYLKMFNCKHGETLPKNMTLAVRALSQSWEEGFGVNYLDKTYDGSGSNWMNNSSGSQWTNPGGTYWNDAESNYTQLFTNGYENLELDISSLVEHWIIGTKPNYGVGIQVTSSQEAYFSSSTGTDSGSVLHNTNGSFTSFYTKKFFARSSEHFFDRPVLEARWNSSVKDQRNSVFFSSSKAPATDNLNTIYLYNFIRGKLTNLPSVGTGNILVSLYSGSESGSAIVPTGSKLTLPIGGGVISNLDTEITGGWYSTGIYTASFAITGSLYTIHDVWHSGGVEYYTGSFNPKSFSDVLYNENQNFVSNITNLRDLYDRNEKIRFRLYVRDRNWQPTIYTVANVTPQNRIIESASYQIRRLSDNRPVIAHNTGSDLGTMLSYDVSGNYFDLDASLLEGDFGYGIQFAYYNDSIGSWIEQPEMFKFRVNKDYV